MQKEIFYAEYKGSFLPEESWEGSVQSTYSKAVNLLHPSGNLISIVGSIDNMTDFGLVVKDFTLLLSKISNGNQFIWNGNQIIFSNIIIDRSRASEWSGTLSNIYTELLIDIVPLKKAFTSLAMEEGLAPVITKKNGNMYSNAAEKIIKKAKAETGISGSLLIDLSYLVGLGLGFTPSGDDFLAGVMLYEAMSGTRIINREALKAKIPGTTLGGRTLLSLVLDNSFPYYLKYFADLIMEGDFSSSELVKNVLKHGSTSGSDTLTGFIWAAENFKKLPETI